MLTSTVTTSTSSSTTPALTVTTPTVTMLGRDFLLMSYSTRMFRRVYIFALYCTLKGKGRRSDIHINAQMFLTFPCKVVVFESADRRYFGKDKAAKMAPLSPFPHHGVVSLRQQSNSVARCERDRRTLSMGTRVPSGMPLQEPARRCFGSTRRLIRIRARGLQPRSVFGSF